MQSHGGRCRVLAILESTHSDVFALCFSGHAVALFGFVHFTVPADWSETDRHCDEVLSVFYNGSDLSNYVTGTFSDPWLVLTKPKFDDGHFILFPRNLIVSLLA